MIQKRLADLNIDELKSEFGKAGIPIQGDFTESLALVKLTIYLASSTVVMTPSLSFYTFLLRKLMKTET